MSQLRELARPFPDRYVHTNPSGGGSYVKHGVVLQRLISVLGTPATWELVEVLRGDLPAKAPNPQGKSQRARDGMPAMTNVIVGVIYRMTAVIDGQTVVIEEVGDCEQPENWPHDGARMKDAISDAVKRCAARVGLGLHLWTGDEYWLDDWFAKNEPVEGELPGATAPVPVLPPDVPDMKRMLADEQAESEVPVPTISPAAVKSKSLTKAQTARIHALVREKGISDVAYRGLLFDRYAVESSTELSSDDAKQLIEHLSGLGGGVDGGEDGRGEAVAEPALTVGAEGARPATAKVPDEPPYAQDPVNGINAAKLKSLLVKSGMPNEQVLHFLSSQYGVTRVSEMRSGDAQLLTQRLERDSAAVCEQIARLFIESLPDEAVSA